MLPAEVVAREICLGVRRPAHADLGIHDSRGKRRAVDRTRRSGKSQQIEDGGEDVGGRDHRCVAARVVPGRLHDEGHPHCRVVDEVGVGRLTMIAEALAMVRGHDDDGVLVESVRVEPVDEPSDLSIRVGDLAEIRLVRELRREWLRRFVRRARLQVIHNAADPGAASVDVYVNGALTLNDFAFRTATPFIDVPAGVLLNIGVAAGNSTSVSDTLKNFQVTLANGGSYLAVANGVLAPASFAANPNGTSTAFTLFVQDQMKESAATATDVDFRVIHGASDAPTVDVLAGASILVNDASYSNITPYLTVPAATYQLDVTPGNNNSVIVASFDAALSGLGGKSAVILASGFLAPAANQNGPAFGLLAVLADGTAILLGNITGIEESAAASTFSIYPNPAADFVRINPTDKAINSTVEISNAIGQVVITERLTNSTLFIPLTGFDKGMYFVSVQNENGKAISKLIVE